MSPRVPRRTQAGPDAIRARAVQYLEAARTELGLKRYDVAFQNARHAAELFAKAVYARTIGPPPSNHEIVGELFRHELLPKGLDPGRANYIVAQDSRGEYGFDEGVTEPEVREALALAEALMTWSGPARRDPKA